MKGKVRYFRRSSKEPDAQYYWHGVSVESATSSSDELNLMLDVLAALTPSQRLPIRSIRCLSDAQHCCIDISRWDHHQVQKVLRTSAAMLFNGGGKIRSLTINPLRGR